MKKSILVTPGPTSIPDSIRELLARPMIHHRSKDFENALKDCQSGLQKLFGTSQDVMTLTCSGTGGMEACVSSLLNSKDQVLVLDAGKFGERFGKITESYKIKTDTLKLEWGKSLSVSMLEKSLKPHHRALLIQHSETSTGALHPLPEISSWIRKKAPDCLLIVDAITSIGAMPFEMDAWGVDAVVTGSQKALMLPPGLAFVSLSPKAIERMKTSDLPGFYFDLKRDLAQTKLSQTSFTPAIPLVMALKESLRLLNEEGFSQVFDRHLKLAEATRKAIPSLGLKLAAEHPSVACTACISPVDTKSLLKKVKDRSGYHIAGAQNEWEGRVLRISHLGWISAYDTLGCLAALGKELERSAVPAKTSEALEIFMREAQI